MMSNYDDNDDPITNPFYYAQDVDGYAERQLAGLPVSSKPSKNQEKNRGEKSEKVKRNASKRHKHSSSPSSTEYIIRRNFGKRARSVIKINIYECKGSEDEHDFSDSENASLSVQYVSENNNNYDEIMDATKRLIKKICEKMHDLE